MHIWYCISYFYMYTCTFIMSGVSNITSLLSACGLSRWECAFLHVVVRWGEWVFPQNSSLKPELKWDTWQRCNIKMIVKQSRGFDCKNIPAAAKGHSCRCLAGCGTTFSSLHLECYCLSSCCWLMSVAHDIAGNLCIGKALWAVWEKMPSLHNHNFFERCCQAAELFMRFCFCLSNFFTSVLAAAVHLISSSNNNMLRFKKASHQNV